MNLAETLIRREFDHLEAEWDSLEDVEHSGVRGFGREASVRNILAQVLPKVIDVSSGIVIDVHGQQSPEFDIILADATVLRALPLSSNFDTRIVPIESVLGTVEVKKSVGTKEFQQLRKQRDKLQKMRPSIVTSGKARHGWLEPLCFLVASRPKTGELQRDDLENELLSLGNLGGALFLASGIVFLMEGSGLTTIEDNKDPRKAAVAFIAHLSALLYRIRESRPDAVVLWYSYLE